MESSAQLVCFATVAGLGFRVAALGMEWIVADLAEALDNSELEFISLLGCVCP